MYHIFVKGDLKENYMLEQLNDLQGTQGGENPLVESISRKDIALSWLGGIIDGEGCIFAGFRKIEEDNNLTVRVTVYNTHPNIIRRVTEILCELEVPFYISSPGGPKKSKPGVTVVVGGKGRVKKLLEMVIPFLYAKRRRAQLALELIAYRESLTNPGKKATWHGVTLQGEPRIKELVDCIRDEVHNYPSVLQFSRQANRPFGESSETTRFPLTQAVRV